jgi:hypothetical protein
MEFEFEMWINICIPIAYFSAATLFLSFSFFIFLLSSYFFLSLSFHHPSRSAVVACITLLHVVRHTNALSLFGSLDNDRRYEIESSDVNKPSFLSHIRVFYVF